MTILTSLPDHRICIAPMLDWSDRHYRYFVRLLSEKTFLYTEMVTTGAILHAGDRFLQYNDEEHPVALQLGGSEPDDLARCAKLAEARGYDEVNLNIGCPSERVQKGAFGACLMAEPELVADCVAAMRAVVDIPVTVKTRIGIDDKDSYEELVQFIDTVAKGGCELFIIHARKAWLKGLSPKQNREIPPLRYEVVKQLKQDFPQLELVVNGGLNTLELINQQLTYAEGVMVGREAYRHPFFVAQMAEAFLGEQLVADRHQVIYSYMDYAARQLELGVRMQTLIKPILGFFHALPGGKQWRRILSENSHQPGAGIEVIEKALAVVGKAY